MTLSQSTAAILAKHSARAEENRLAMPKTAAILDQLRQTFPEARIRFAEEGGRVVGKPLGKGVAASDMVLIIPEVKPSSKGIKQWIPPKQNALSI